MIVVIRIHPSGRFDVVYPTGSSNYDTRFPGDFLVRVIANVCENDRPQEVRFEIVKGGGQ